MKSPQEEQNLLPVWRETQKPFWTVPHSPQVSVIQPSFSVNLSLQQLLLKCTYSSVETNISIYFTFSKVLSHTLPYLMK